MLRIHEVAVELVAEVMPMLGAIQRFDPDLARQGRKATDEHTVEHLGGERPGRQAKDAALPNSARLGAGNVVGAEGR